MTDAALAERRADTNGTRNSGIDTGIPRSCPVDVQFVDPAQLDYCEAFIPGILDDPASFVDCISLPMPDKSWRPLSFLATKYELGPIDPLRLVHLHVRAGREHEPQTIPGLPFAFDAIGIKLHPSTVVSYVNLDLDDGPSKPTPAAYIDALRRMGASPLITRGSGNPRRFRALLRLAHPMPIEQVHFLMREVFRGLGVKCPEIYPSTTIASRLPGGNRACVMFYLDDLTSPRPLPFDELVHAWNDLPAFDLDDAYARFAPRPALEQYAHETNPVEHESSDEKPSKRKGKKLALTAKERADVERYRREGIQPDERLAAIALLVKDDFCRGFTKERTEDDLAQWAHDGGIARSNHHRKRYKSRYIAAQIEDIPRHVAFWFAAYEAQTSPAVDLSVRDILNLAPHVERVAKQLGITVKRAGMFALETFPRWKGYPDAIRTDKGIVTHWTIWKDAAGNKSDYDAIREAFGLWRPTSGYLPQHRSTNGEGYARTWACDFVFDDESPARALGRTWQTALDTAKARQDKPSCKARRKKPRTNTSSTEKTK